MILQIYIPVIRPYRDIIRTTINALIARQAAIHIQKYTDIFIRENIGVGNA